MQPSWRRQRGLYCPPGIPRVDWSNPITVNLAQCLVFMGGWPIDVALHSCEHNGFSGTNGIAFLTQGTPGPLLPNVAGAGTYYDGTTFFSHSAAQESTPFDNSQRGTILGFFTLHNGCATDAWGFGWQDATNVTRWDFTNSAFTDPRALRCFMSLAGGGTVNTSQSIVYEQPTVGGFAWDAGPGTLTGYLNGVQDGQTTGLTPSGAGSMCTVGGHFDGTGLAKVTFHLTMGWKRALRNEEHFEISRNPTCFLIYPEDDAFATSVGKAAAPPPVTVAQFDTGLINPAYLLTR